MLIGIGNAAIVLFFEVVFRKIGIAAAPLPELLDELLALFIGVQLQESLTFFRGNNVNHVLVEPLLVRSVQFLERLLHLSFLFFAELLGSRRGIRIVGVLR